MNRQVVIRRPGGPEVLAVVERPIPVPGPGMVRVRVLSAGVACADILMRKGVYPGAPCMPFVPAYDIVGTVDALGPGVAGFTIGQRVAALTRTGGYTTYSIVPAAELIPVPGGVDSAEAVSALLNYVTAYQLLHREARVRPGECVLVQGAAGGVGTALLELGRLAGLTVYGALTGGGVDAVFDGVGGASVHHSYRMLRARGRLVAYGVGPAVSQRRIPLLGIIDSVARLAALRLIPGRRTVLFYEINPMRRRHPDWFQADVAAVFAHLARGEIRPIVSERLPLEQAARAQSLLEAGQSRGKVVLVPS